MIQLPVPGVPEAGASPRSSPGLPAIVIASDGIDLPGGRPIGANYEQCDQDNENEARQEAGNEEEQVGHVSPRSMEQPGEPPLYNFLNVNSSFSTDRR
jgi:hypothetical protein